MRHLTFDFENSSGRLNPHEAMITSAFDSAARAAHDLLYADAIKVIFRASPEETIFEMEVGGYTYGPNDIVVAVDPDSPYLSEQHLSTTLVHEFHHAIRWRGAAWGENFGETIVSEGLAQLFEEEVLGTPPIYSQVRIKQSEIELVKSLFDQREFNHPRWFFGAEDITKWFGYAFGYQLCRDYATSVGKRASELVDAPTLDVLEFGPH